MEHLTSKPLSNRLYSLVNGYRQLSGKHEKLTTVDALPRMGPILIFSFNKLMYQDNKSMNAALVGFQHQPFNVKVLDSKLDCLIVRFTSYGLSRFTKLPMHLLTNQIIEGELVLGKGIYDLHEALLNTDDFLERVSFVEQYLLQLFNPPIGIDKGIFRLANDLQFNNHSIKKEDIPLSTRQLERRFKTLTGVNIQTFTRFSRFDNTKLALINGYPTRLIEIGHDAGYYDQAHFSNEFYAISGIRPKKFLHSLPFYKYLAESYQYNGVPVEE